MGQGKLAEAREWETKDPNTYSLLGFFKMSVGYRLPCQQRNLVLLAVSGGKVIINSHYNSSISYHVLSIFHVEGSVLHYRVFCT